MTDRLPPTAESSQPFPRRRLDLLGAIDTPLKFYVLALLIVETFLGVTLVGARLDAELQETVWGKYQPLKILAEEMGTSVDKLPEG